MNKAQAYTAFWNSFNVPAYDQNTVPDDAPFPRITFEYAEDFFNYEVALTASVWYYSTSWLEITQKGNEIAEKIGAGGTVIRYDDGAMWIKRSAPFIRRMSDGIDDNSSKKNDMVRRLIINISVDYLSN